MAVPNDGTPSAPLRASRLHAVVDTALQQQPHRHQLGKGKKKILAKQPGDADPDQLPSPPPTGARRR